MGFKQYPILFQPILKDRIWGGTKLKSILGKDIDSNEVGESWEISGVSSDVSVVANGVYEGLSLNDLIQKFPEEILGDYIINRFDKKFPLLFKFLDAKEDLSIQLHPNDDLAQKRHGSFGKTEMWYVMQTDENARIVVDFKDGVTQQDYLHHLEAKTLPSILKEIPVKKGDVFFIETGTIHAIGAGVLLAEIQQTSDITYRVYDWDRLDASGNSRELHIDMALDAINYDKKDVELTYTKDANVSNEIVACPFFSVNYIPLKGSYQKVKDASRFYLYVCTEGEGEIILGEEVYPIQCGQTVLIPAAVSQIRLSGEATILEIFVS
ncbi:type I phosphomannose isomerase catalytic subunit [Myroides profundi]|uniref:Phosphohexomutase n=1 Tax=Myroides profundi TaxID=480520 RepID=A0AAJ5BF36_MYRPR|nr:type I phosphomannose isomerase catalytic subunit [Myroides profundi]AJH16061.1 mannose-6-phosphate isomerase [Myroides profundi]SER40563.1 mannose-6-phosphate isomerase, type 1 [Myroides profundi]